MLLQSTPRTQEDAPSGSGSTVLLSEEEGPSEGLNVLGKRRLHARAIVSDSDSDTPDATEVR